jgi:hypothetical protein
MRWALALLLLSCASCRQQRDFDERYNETAAELENKARALDQKVANGAVDDLSTNAADNQAFE